MSELGGLEMPETRTIEIDFDVHKVIETERQSFTDTPNAALRRLLKLGVANKPAQRSTDSDALRGSWTGKGVTLPVGTELRMEYRSRDHRGVIQDSAWLVEGQRFNSPSAAAGGVATTKSGNRPSLDGWKYWQVKRPGDTEWTALSLLRKMTVGP